MIFLSEEKARELAAELANRISIEAYEQYQIMEFSGGHSHALSRHGIRSLLPKNIRLSNGPGCPVCMLPPHRINMAIEIAQQKNVLFCTYGDMLRVPGSPGNSLALARAKGADVRVIYSALESVALAEQNPDKNIVFFAVGFEPTLPATAMAIRQAAEKNLLNFKVFCNHLLSVAGMAAILQKRGIIQGILAPGHVAAVTGIGPFKEIAQKYQLPMVISGFEPVEMLYAILHLVRMMNERKTSVKNAYAHVVSASGNIKAQQLVDSVFPEIASFLWRGFGELPQSAPQFADEYRHMDAEGTYDVKSSPILTPRECACDDVVLGLRRPRACALFKTACTPDKPVGACMISMEGSCNAAYLYEES